jgi:hypothetical protein
VRKILFCLPLMLISAPVVAQDLCHRQCPDHAPKFSRKDMVCLEKSIDVIAPDDWILSAPGDLPDAIKAVLASLKDAVSNFEKNKQADQPDCNWAAQLRPDLNIDAATQQLCTDHMSAQEKNIKDGTVSKSSDDIALTIFCRGNFQFGGFPWDEYLTATK